ncbi:MAG: c-type cytochrome, partial [Phycisphaerae bacterium]
VYAEQWRWEFTYPNGHADPELHVPLDRAVRLVMHTRSQDVIHSLYIPAFRLKQDIVPGRYTYAWFRATRPGQYPLVCAEYCGTGHSQMVTRVVVHEPGGYERWLALADPLKRLSAAQYAAYLADPQEFIRANPEFAGLEPPASIGARVYRKKGCRTCHSVDGSAGVGPSFRGLFGRAVVLADGSRVSADENYLRRSILAPGAQVVAGFDAVMPPYQGRISDRQINALIEYIKSLRP